MQIAITAPLAFTPLERIVEPIIVVEDGRILSVGTRETTPVPSGARLREFRGAVLAPGFIDIHIHGGAGYDVMQGDDTALDAIECHLLRQGVTSYLPTTVTAPVDLTVAALEKLSRRIENASRRTDGFAQPLGVHLEGPFISHAKRGVHPPADLQPPSPELLGRLCSAAHDHVALITVAPELPGAREMIAAAAQRNICASLGHSDGSFNDATRAIQAGARHATHTFNAMRALDHRQPGILGAVLSDERMTADIIADGIHVHPAVVALFLKSKGPGGAVLITDAISATGCGDGRYRLGAFEVEVKGDRCELDGRLAGSVLTLDRAVRNVMQFAGVDLQQAVRLATLNPARVAGVGNRKGMLAPGHDADIVVLTPRGEVTHTICRGVVR